MLIIAIWYNETRLSKAFGKMSESNKILKYTNLLNGSLIESQTHFNEYITNNRAGSLTQYSNSLDSVRAFIDSLGQVSKENRLFEDLLAEKTEVEANLVYAKKTIDSIVDLHVTESVSAPKPYSFGGFASDKFMDNVDTQTYISVKDADKKGFFARIGDAISGRVSVKQEYINTVVTVRYQDKVVTGDVEEQMAAMLKISDDYYRSEFEKLRQAFANLREGDRRLMTLNNKLLSIAQKTASSYNRFPEMLGDQDGIKNQYESAVAIRNYALVFLVLLMLALSLILIQYTRKAFENERQLIAARDRIGKSLDFKNRITALISHEIRSPLGIVSYYSRNAGAASKDAEMKEMLHSIEFTTNSLLLLSNQILEHSRDESQPMELKSKPFSLKQEMTAITDSMRALVEPRGNRLETKLDIADEEVNSDLGRIHQLFYNIVGNANKFTEEGLISIIIDAKKVSDFEVDMRVTIADNGVGIASDQLSKVFQSHYQAGVPKNANDLGIGLGLSICREIVTLFDGEIAIDSELGSGTTVSFNLVLALN